MLKNTNFATYNDLIFMLYQHIFSNHLFRENTFCWQKGRSLYIGFNVQRKNKLPRY